MQSASLPLDVLADELGAAAGRIERELRLQDEARAARFEARLVAIELASFKAEEERQRKFEARMAELRDGRDGEPGKDGKDADIGPLIEKLDNRLLRFDSQVSKRDSDMFSAIVRMEDRLAEVKDGEPGRDGKDADNQLIIETLDEEFTRKFAGLEDEVQQRLAQVRDGKDGEPGKDADIGPVFELVDGIERKHRSFLDSLEADLSARVDAKLAEVRDGQDGKEGPPGKDGKDGQDGKLPISQAWTRDTVYYEGDVVRHNRSTYQALTNTGTEPPGDHWGELAGRGTDGRGFVLRGTYDATAEYRQHDIVMINRNSFAAKYDDPGECPGEGWQLFGPSGQRGKEGPPGSPGAKGADGRIVSITKWEADPDEMVLRIADSTGNTFTVDLQPIAERILEAAR